MRYALIGLVVWVGLGLGVPSAWADSTSTIGQTVPQAVGLSFPSLHISDQHDTPVQLPGEAEVIVFSNTKAVDEWVNPVLAAFGQKQMSAHHVIYLSDIHRMPWIISKMIALPKLRERHYSVALIREAQEVPMLIEPGKECLNWVRVASGKVISITPVCSPPDLETRLDALVAH